MIGMGMKRIVKFLTETQPEDIIQQLVHIIEAVENTQTQVFVQMCRNRGKHCICINKGRSDAFHLFLDIFIYNLRHQYLWL